MLVDCYVELGSFYGGQKISNCIDLSYFDISQGTSFFQHTCGLWSPYAAKSLQWARLYMLIYVINDFLSFCILLCPLSSSPQPTLSIPYDFVPKKLQPKWCCRLPHIGLSPSFTGRNRSPILVDCCVNDCWPLFGSIGSFTAHMVVLRMVCCEVQTLRQNMFPCWS